MRNMEHSPLLHLLPIYTTRAAETPGMVCIDNTYARNKENNKLTAYAQATDTDYKVTASCPLGRN